MTSRNVSKHFYSRQQKYVVAQGEYFEGNVASVVQGQRAGLQYSSSWVQTRPKPSDFQGEKILSTPSFRGVPCPRFSACKRSLNLRGSRNLDKITGQFLSHSSTSLCQDLSRRCGRTGTCRRKWECPKARESSGKLTSKSCPGCSVPEPHRSHDWALVPANPAFKAEY